MHFLGSHLWSLSGSYDGHRKPDVYAEGVMYYYAVSDVYL